MKLVAFCRTAAGLFKIYDHGTDWQVIGPNFERWRSVWQHDKAASLKAAAAIVPGAGVNWQIINEAQS